MTGTTAASDVDYDARARELLGFSRWWQVAAAGLMMGLVSPYQYVWSSIEGPLAESLGLPLPALGLVFTLFVVFQAGSQFPVGWWRDRRGPRRLTLAAGVLVGGGYVGLAHATRLWQLYLLYSLGAVGVGIVYTVAVNTAIKWFPDRRGLTTGVGTMAFAGGSALFIPYVRANATVSGYATVLQSMGLLMAVTIVAGAFVLRDPPLDWDEPPTDAEADRDSGIESPATDDAVPGDGGTGGAGPEATGAGDAPADGAAVGDRDGDPETDGGSVAGDRPDYSSSEMVRTWQFWTMYAMFVGVSGAGLMLTAKVVSFAQHFGLTETVVTVSATVLPIAGGVGRLLLGDLSDRLDRERAMAISFVLCGVGLYFVVLFGVAGVNVAFVGAVVVATFFWSPQYTLFPSVVGDYYGERHSSANYALLYSGKMWGGVFGGFVTGWLVTLVGWDLTFVLGGTLAVAAGVAALFLRAPQPG